MASVSSTVQYVVKMRDKISPTINKIQGKLSRLKASFKAFGAQMRGISTLGAGIGLYAVGNFVNKSIQAYDKQAQALAQVRQGLQSTNNIAGQTLDQLAAKASQFQNKTLFGDEEILQGVTAQILTFTNITGKQFNRVQQSVLDVTTRLKGANATGEDLRATSIMLGKALNDPVANLGALSRSGIQFSKKQKELIKNLWNTGRQAEAQTMVLEELEKQYGGSAEAAAKAGAGGLKQLSNRFEDLKEKIGKQLLPFVNKLAKVFGKIASFAEKNERTFSFLIQTLVILAATIGTVIIATKAWQAAQVVFNGVLKNNPIGKIIMLLALLASVIMWAVKNWDALKVAWEANVKLMQNALDNLVMVFKHGLKGIWYRFQLVGLKIKTWVQTIVERFKRLGQAIKMALTGDFEGAAKLMSKKIETAADKQIEILKKRRELEKKQFNLLIKGRAYQASLLTKKMKQAWDKTGSFTDALNIGDHLAGVSDTTNPDLAAQTGESVVKAGGIKSFNINISSLTGIQTLHTTNIKDSESDLSKAITGTILKAISDVQVT